MRVKDTRELHLQILANHHQAHLQELFGLFGQHGEKRLGLNPLVFAQTQINLGNHSAHQ
jgi:hypothetical protein